MRETRKQRVQRLIEGMRSPRPAKTRRTASLQCDTYTWTGQTGMRVVLRVYDSGGSEVEVRRGNGRSGVRTFARQDNPDAVDVQRYIDTYLSGV